MKRLPTVQEPGQDMTQFMDDGHKKTAKFGRSLASRRAQRSARVVCGVCSCSVRCLLAQLLVRRTVVWPPSHVVCKINFCTKSIFELASEHNSFWLLWIMYLYVLWICITIHFELTISTYECGSGLLSTSDILPRLVLARVRKKCVW